MEGAAAAASFCVGNFGSRTRRQHGTGMGESIL